MDRFISVMFLCVVAIAQLPTAGAQAEQTARSQSALKSDIASVNLSVLPPAPKGRSTILGGQIRSVDLVRDQFELKVFGQRPLKILFDGRTQAYLDGKSIHLRDLRSGDHVSVQTVLDGTNVFAISIHTLSRSPEGDYQGYVLNYNPESNELTISTGMSQKPIKLIVPISTPVAREGQGAISSAHTEPVDLVKGALISVKFESDNKGRGIARQIAILATPGSMFEFSGELSSLDMHSGLLVIVDPRDGKDYEIVFDSSRLPASKNLHEGDQIRVKASFDGTRYVASTLNVD